MTTPIERTRSMRWMHEFLYELQSAENLTETERAKLAAIVLHHPTGREISQWASEKESLEPEDRTSAQPSKVPDDWPDGPRLTSPAERAKAMLDAFHFLRYGAVKWTDLQRREIAYVLRHYPGSEHGELTSVISHEQWLSRKDPSRTPWVLPFTL